MHCFTKTQRLLKKIDYDRVFQQAKKISTSDYIILYRDNTLGHARLGLALSKKMIAKAHDRNRVKRLVRETFRTHEQLPAVDIIVLAKKGVACIKNMELITGLNKTWRKLTNLNT